MTATYSFLELKEAIEKCTPYTFTQTEDESGKTVYLLSSRRGAGDGDPFYNLSDVEEYVSNSDEVQDYLLWKKGDAPMPTWME